MKFPALIAALTLCACATMGPKAPADAFFAEVSALCGKTFEGRLVSTDAVDRDFAGKALRMSVQDCTATQVRIPFSVGEDRSRTWVVTRTAGGVRLKHEHRHPDGTEDPVSQYGGDTVAEGTAERQEFPVDAFTDELFIRQGRAVSNSNVWALEVHPGWMFAYELRRPGRYFRVEFDLAKPAS